MDSRQLDYFISVVDNLSLAKAAAEFFFTPQAMRKHIEALEAEVGVPLLERSNKGVRPTEAGSVFYGYARKLRALSQESLTRTREAAGLARPRLTLGLYRNANLFLMPKLVGAFKERHPEVELAYVDLPSYQKIDEALVNGTIDATMTVGNARARKQGIRYLTIEYERPLCSVAVNDPLAAREQLRLEDLHGRTVVTFTPGASHWHDALVRHIKEHEPEVSIVETGTNESGVLALQQKGALGVGVPIVTSGDLWQRASIPFEVPPGLDECVSVDLATCCPHNPLVRALLHEARYICATELGFGVADHSGMRESQEPRASSAETGTAC